jgi:hypothetical protein
MKFVIILISLFLLVACKKDKQQEDTAITLQRKWTLESFSTKDYDANGTLVATYPGNTYGITYDFQANNTVIIYTGYTNYTKTLPYTMFADSVSFEGYTYAIKNLTSKTVTLLRRENDPYGRYAERIYDLKR